ncbi:MAG: hypothetical protein V3573_07295 [Desulfovibrionaceae bacterium]
MFKLKHIAPTEAQGTVKDVYDAFPPQVGIPEPMQMFSISPGLQHAQMEVLKYYMGHSRLEFPLLAAARYMAASRFGYDYCVDFNAGLLQAAGMLPAQIEMLQSELDGNLDDFPFDERELDMLRLVRKVIDRPEEVGDADVAKVRSAGWSDADIFDVCANAAMLQGTGTLFKAFRN